MFKFTRSHGRMASAEYPVGSPDLGYFDPVTAIAVGAGVNAVGALLGADAQKDATKAASNIEQARLDQMKPFLQAGTESIAGYREGIGQQPTYADILKNLPNDPGYQFEMAQGQDAIQGSAAARGLLRSGRTLKDLVSYAQNLATTRAGDAYTREMGAFNNKQNQLFNLVQLGANAGGAQSNLPQLALAAGDARANMYTGLANTGTNALQNLLLANQLQGGMNSAVSNPVVVQGPNGPITNSATISWSP